MMSLQIEPIFGYLTFSYKIGKCGSQGFRTHIHTRLTDDGKLVRSHGSSITYYREYICTNTVGICPTLSPLALYLTDQLDCLSLCTV